jgi:hypothetical protein
MSSLKKANAEARAIQDCRRREIQREKSAKSAKSVVFSAEPYVISPIAFGYFA